MRVRVFHQKASEASELIHSLAAAGHTVEYDEKHSPVVTRSIRESPPDAVVIDLSRLPSHGREIATYLRGLKATRTIPIVFVDGAPEKVAAIRALMPDAAFTTGGLLPSTLIEAVTNRPVNPVVPLQMMDRYAGRSAAQKLGIKPGMRVGVIGAPRNYDTVLGPLPESATLVEDADDSTPVTLWFAEHRGTLQAQLRKMAKRAARSKL
jgi:CheY-like chemotaxis protein